MNKPVFPSLPKKQQEALELRSRCLGQALPAWATLEKKLLEIAGLAVVAPLPFQIESVWPAWTWTTEMLSQHGMLVEYKRILRRRLARNECHNNARMLHQRDPTNILYATGYGLSDDGLWRNHSWCMRDDVLIETTISRMMYFGMLENDRGGHAS